MPRDLPNDTVDLEIMRSLSDQRDSNWGLVGKVCKATQFVILQTCSDTWTAKKPAKMTLLCEEELLLAADADEDSSDDEEFNPSADYQRC